jgi:uncharacterized protein (TIRG00374 family)
MTVPEIPPRPRSISRRAQAVVFACGLAAFVFLIARAGVRETAANVYEARWVLGPIVLVWGGVYICNTVAWRLLLGAVSVDHGDGHAVGVRAPTVPFARAYAITVASFAINYITPFVNLGGEPFRIAAAAPYVGTSRSAASVVCFRLVHTMAQITFWITALPLAYLALPHTPGLVVALAGIATCFGVVLMVLFGLARQKTVQRTLQLMGRLPLIRRLAARLERNRSVLERVDAQLAALWGPERGRFLGAMVAEYVGRGLAVVEYLFITRAIGLDVSYLTAFVIGALSQFLLNMLFFIPFDVGTKEGGMYLIFRLLRLPARLGIYAAIVMRLRELVWIALGLGFVWPSRAGAD